MNTGPGSDWPEIFNMAAAWFKGVQRRICLDYNDTVNKLFHKWFTSSTSIAKHSHHSHMRTRDNHCRAHPQDPPPEWTDAPVHPNHVTNLRKKYMANHVIWLLRNRGKLWEGRRWKSDGDSGGDRDNDNDSEFWELRDLWHLACAESIVHVLCSVWWIVFSV